MSKPETQLMVARKVGLTPTRRAVLEDEGLLKENPLFRDLKPVFEGATPRPVTPRYAQVTLALQSAVSRALASGDVEATLRAAKPNLEAITSK
jgi:multiple sugar transport system substrate-binding protein